ncbi:MAG: cupin domain-containing protein [Betaproteobacteria bacterium]|nr:cupin domain-containing protein [Betaproteobacteria bacterium]
MIVTRIYAAPDGKACIERREVPMAPDASGRATSPDFAALRLFFRDTPPAHVHQKHRAPQRQFIFVTSGIGEIELADGTRHRFAPGDVLFAEDTTGEGHVTRTLEGTRGFAHVPVPAGFDITRWPLA